MYCQWCGARLAEGATTCASCGKSAPGAVGSAVPPPPPPASDPIDRAIHETSQAAHELADAAHRFADAVVRRARGDRSVTAKKAREAAHEVAEELKKAGKEIEKVLDEL